jgi:predicted transcriptional regulator
MPRQPTIGKAELEILRFIHDHPGATVRDVAGHFSKTHGHVRTTVLNVMGRLCGKGFLTRRKIDGVFTYSAKQSKGDLFRRLVRDFVDTALGGSFSPFVAYLARDAKLTPQDVEDLRRLVRELDGHSGGGNGRGAGESS